MIEINHSGLSEVRVLLVEDDPLLLMELELTLVDAGAVVAGACRTLQDAMSRSSKRDFSVAILDFRLGSETVSPVARELESRGIPFVLYTGQARHDVGLAEWQDSWIVEKPAPPAVILSAVQDALMR